MWVYTGKTQFTGHGFTVSDGPESSQGVQVSMVLYILYATGVACDAWINAHIFSLAVRYSTRLH
jgi:hypothetical protein